jgi:cytochrome c oxidase cbb3-type subunit 3
VKLSIRQPSLIVAVLVAGSSVVSAFGLSRIAGPEPLAPDRSASAAHGRQLFVQSCAHCHGDDARGNGEDGDGPDLFRLRIGNARIAAVIHGGIPDEMPSFARKHGPPDISDLTAYLRTLQ